MKNVNAPRDYTEFLSATLSFLAVNLLWIFFALWLLYGIVPVLLLAIVMNHMINRLETRLLVAERQVNRRL
ncbi:MAG: hypothetical protein BM562_18265 [Alphaproteobacteria bacterium MedPE-SWcel]|nr:MAG: hypothetical protein BM562_18265 [Alphaproteobacteria bacterium MedPE-SWcel]